MSKDHPDVVCKNCKWYDEGTNHGKGTGLCRVASPAAQVTRVYKDTYMGSRSENSYFNYECGVWPTVSGDVDWCGSYRMA